MSTDGLTRENIAIIMRLRNLAIAGASMRELVMVIQTALAPTFNGAAMIWFFSKAFGLTIGQGKDILGSAIFGQAAHTEAEINALLLPVIQQNLSSATGDVQFRMTVSE
jgi:hypothetical protein